MSNTLKHAVLAAVFAAGAGIFSFAGADAGLPAIKTLGCEESCAKWTDPKPIGDNFAGFPSSDELRRSDLAEGFVALRFTITADGHVKDPIILRLIGPESYGAVALNAVKKWRYEPATADGVPAERPNWYHQLIYTIYEPGVQTRPEVLAAHKQASDLIEQGKYAEANALLLPVLEQPRLTLYERAMVSLALSVSYGKMKDYTTAREYAADATIANAQFVDHDAREFAIRQRIRMEAATGQYGDALDWFEKLKKEKSISDDDFDAKLVKRVEAQVANPEPLRAVGYIPARGTQYSWTHILLRRQFAIPVIQGKLDQALILCDQKKTVSAVTTTAEWHIPKSWSNCRVVVTGDAGAKFQFVEVND